MDANLPLTPEGTGLMRCGGTFRLTGTCGTATEWLRVGGQRPSSASQPRNGVSPGIAGMNGEGKNH